MKPLISLSQDRGPGLLRFARNVTMEGLSPHVGIRFRNEATCFGPGTEHAFLESKPMDDETKQAFSALLTRMNEGFERVLNRIEALEKDFSNTKGFLISDSLVASRRWFDLEDRVSELERKQKS